MEKKLKPNEYQCEICHGVFEKGWTEEEANAERSEIFGSPVAEDDGLVCDDCFNKHIKPQLQ
jgi:hypothetical protein